ncbi:MAG: DUF1284 domain-containing protein [Deltaproteobacteria bacterium]|nr:DUF1284 domain-containing protein [Deltaproteobacteria bacterium]
MKLRPHHLFCVQGFQGKGYADDYTDNLQRIADAVAANPRLEVDVVDGPDDVCARCPYLEDGVCHWEEAGEEAVRAHDAALLAVLGLRDGQVTSIDEVRHRFRGEPAVAAEVRRQCSTCAWLKDCAFMGSQSSINVPTSPQTRR